MQPISDCISWPVADQLRVPRQVRGQEGDFWKGQVDFTPPEFYPFGKHREQDLINRQL